LSKWREKDEGVGQEVEIVARTTGEVLITTTAIPAEETKLLQSQPMLENTTLKMLTTIASEVKDMASAKIVQ
jgi:hypothetical protein